MPARISMPMCICAVRMTGIMMTVGTMMTVSIAAPTAGKQATVTGPAGTLPIERYRVYVVVFVNLLAARIGLTLVFRRKARGVIHIVAGDSVTILAILPRIENVLMPELVHFLRWRRKNVVLALMGQRIK